MIHLFCVNQNFKILYMLTSLRGKLLSSKGLAAGGGIGKARTRAKSAVAHKVSYEPRPRLRQTQVFIVRATHATKT
jgi:hypothetical protein